MKRDKKFEELLERLRREDDAFDRPQPLRLVLRFGEDGLELAEHPDDRDDPSRLFPREFEIAMVPGPDTIQ